MTGEAASAYLLSQFKAASKEAERLDEQAQAFIEYEFEFLEPWLKKDQQVADFGCGTGTISRAVARHQPTCRVWGYDADERSVQESRNRAGELPNVSYRQWKLEADTCPAEAPFDLALTRLLLLHLQDPLAAIKSMVASIRPGGRLYAVDCDDGDMEFLPTADWQRDLILRLEKAQSNLGGTRSLGHLLPGLLENASLQEIEARKVFYRKRDLGIERFQKIFEPVMRHYLGASEDEGLIAQAVDFIQDSSTDLNVCFWHVTGVVS